MRKNKRKKKSFSFAILRYVYTYFQSQKDAWIERSWCQKSIREETLIGYKGCDLIQFLLYCYCFIIKIMLYAYLYNNNFCCIPGPFFHCKPLFFLTLIRLRNLSFIFFFNYINIICLLNATKVWEFLFCIPGPDFCCKSVFNPTIWWLLLSCFTIPIRGIMVLRASWWLDMIWVKHMKEQNGAL